MAEPVKPIFQCCGFMSGQVQLWGPTIVVITPESCHGEHVCRFQVMLCTHIPVASFCKRRLLRIAVEDTSDSELGGRCGFSDEPSRRDEGDSSNKGSSAFCIVIGLRHGMSLATCMYYSAAINPAPERP